MRERGASTKPQVIVLLAAPIALSSCGPSLTPAQEAALQAVASRPVLCRAGNDCEVRWGRALLWVQTYSAYKVRIAGDSMIATVGPWRHDERPAYTITKTANGDGSYTISFQAECDYLFGCVPSLLEAKASFVSFVMAETAPYSSAAPPVARPQFDGVLVDRKAAERAISEGVARFGRIDTLVNSAGIFIAKPFTQYTGADYAAILRHRHLAPAQRCRYACRA